MTTQEIIYTSENTFINSAAKRIETELLKNIQEKGWASLVCSGGKTPIPILNKLAKSKKIDWKKVYLFLSDERYVASEHPDSNYEMLRKSLINKIQIPKNNIFRYKTELPYKTCIEDYEKHIQNFFNKKNQGKITFDIVLLGLGGDGHIASLFPHTKALDEKVRLTHANETKVFTIKKRISLTYPALCNAKKTYFLLNGKEKKDIWKKTLQSPLNFHKYPAQKIVQSTKTVMLGYFGA